MKKFFTILVLVGIIVLVKDNFTPGTKEAGEDTLIGDTAAVGGLIARYHGKREGTSGDEIIITIYEDRVEYEHPNAPEDNLFIPKNVTILIEDIKKLNRWGTNFLIRAHDDSSIEFQLLNPSEAKKLKAKLIELMEQYQ